MCSNPAIKKHLHERDVRNVGAQIGATGADDFKWHLTHNPQDDRDIVRRKRPKGVFPCAYLAKIQPMAHDITDLPQLSRLD